MKKTKRQCFVVETVRAFTLFAAVPRRLGTPPLLVLVAVALMVPTAGPARGEDVLEIHRHTEWRASDGTLVLSDDAEGRLYLGEGRARFDQGEGASWILLQEEGKLVLLNHPQKTFQEFALPVRLEDYASPEEQEKLRKVAPSLVPEMELSRTGETREIEGWQARKWVLEGKPPEGTTTYTYELWLADLPIDEELCAELLRSFGAAHFVQRGIASRMAELPGFPVLRRSVVGYAHGRRDLDTRRLVSLTAESVPPGFYTPPEGYRRLPFVLADWMQFN